MKREALLKYTNLAIDYINSILSNENDYIISKAPKLKKQYDDILANTLTFPWNGNVTTSSDLKLRINFLVRLNLIISGLNAKNINIDTFNTSVQEADLITVRNLADDTI